MERMMQKRRTHIPEPISVAFGDLEFVVKSLQLAGVDRKLCRGNQPIEAFELLTAKLSEGGNPAL